ncbi:MAG: hypothetical protein JXR38_05270 [Bacilli bacterium]|nr:hypothetical protein [Bacilli bacterium]
MMLAVDLGGLNWKLIIIVAVGVIALMIFLAVMINKGRYASRYKNFYKRMDKAINKKYNGNLLNETIANNYLKDNTNTYKSLKAKGKRKVKKYFEYYVKSLPELVFLKSFIAADKKKSQLVILILNEMNKVVAKWDKSRKLRGLIKVINKQQMLMPVIGYFFELPIHIHQGLPYRMTNHENGLILSYDIVKSVKGVKRKQKEKPLTKKQLKAQAKMEAMKQKQLEKQNRKRH